MPIFGEPVPSSTGSPTGTSTAGDTGVTNPPDQVVAATGAADVGASGAPVTEAPKSYLDASQYGDHLVTVKVDGADMELPLKDALQGVMMQQAFTRRTQELAAQRRELGHAQGLVQALENNPRETLAQLAQAYELDLTNVDTSNMDPQEQRLAALEDQLRQQTRMSAQSQIQSELEQLRTQFGEFDQQAVVQHAANYRIPVTTAYRDLNYERLLQEQQRQGQAAQNRNNAIAAQAVSGGQATQPGSVGAQTEKINSVHDAWRAAKRQHGIT